MTHSRGEVTAVAAKRLVFVVTSVIHPSPKPLSYSSVRSVFSSDERISQTLKTIDSIRRYYKDAFIVLVEMGLSESIGTELRVAADKVIFVGNNKIVRWACDSKHKGLGEAIGLIAAIKSVRSLGDFYFKISGRYYLSERFNPQQWESNDFMARRYGVDMSTRLYGFPVELFSAWQSALYMGLPWLLNGVQIEHVMPKFLSEARFTNIDILGIAGDVSPDGTYLEE